MIKLTDKVCLITGGAASIGLSITRKLYELGAKIVVADISAEKANALMNEFSNKVTFVHTDLRDDKQLEELINQTLKNYGKIDVLVNNAVTYGDQGAGTSREVWLDTLNTNLVSVAILSELCRPYLKAAKGNIINIGSISGSFPHIGRWAYPISKSAAIHLNKTLALEYASDGIRVNMVQLGHVWSDPFRALTKNNKEHANKVVAPLNLLERVAEGEEVANVVAFVASDLASYMTGSVTVVDGGYSAMGPEQDIPLMPLLTIS